LIRMGPRGVGRGRLSDLLSEKRNFGYKAV
jgi:hypothetical protein